VSCYNLTRYSSQPFATFPESSEKRSNAPLLHREMSRKKPIAKTNLCCFIDSATLSLIYSTVCSCLMPVCLIEASLNIDQAQEK
jgi:hypothetical protein